MFRRPRWYVLNDDKTVSPVEDIRTWAARLSLEDDSKRRVAFTDINEDVMVSTVFLGIDHNFFGDGPPILFETMVFGGKFNQHLWRCSTFAEALMQHEKACEIVQGNVALLRRK